MCACVFVYSLLLGNPDFISLSTSTSGVGGYKVAMVGRPATDHGNVAFQRVCVCVCVCV